MGVGLGQSLKYMDVYFLFKTALHGPRNQYLVIMHLVKVFFSVLKKPHTLQVQVLTVCVLFLVWGVFFLSYTEFRGFFYETLRDLFLF